MSDAKQEQPAEKPSGTVSEEQPVKPEPFWLVLFSDASDVPPRCIRCENTKSLTRAIDEHVLSASTALHVFAFEGRRIEVSSPRPVCSVKVAGEQLDVGRDNAEYDEGGRIVPLVKPLSPE